MDRFTSMLTFICVVDAGSFSAAAKRLNIGQPAVSKSVARLEDRLGVRLLLRSTRGLLPTEAGQLYYERAKRSLESADDAELAARGAGWGLQGTLRISAAVTFARLHLLPRFSEFIERHPDLSVDILLDDRNIDLVEHGVDVALRMGDLGDSGMAARHLARTKRVVVGTSNYFREHGEPQSPSELVAHRAIIYSNSTGGDAWTFRRGEVESSIVVSGRVRFTAAEGVRAAVLSDMGIAISPTWMFADALASGAARTVLDSWTLPPIDLWAVFPAGRMISAKARVFVDFVESMIRPIDGTGTAAS